jgi:hypothetical protein
MFRRRFIFRPPIPKTQPEGTVVPVLNDDGTLTCPVCEGRCRTPVAPNPYRAFRPQRMILRRGEVRCPHRACYAVHWIDDALALRHNRLLYPEDYPPPHEAD